MIRKNQTCFSELAPIYRLTEEQRNEIDRMVMSTNTYSEVADTLRSYGVNVPLYVVCRYAKDVEKRMKGDGI